MSTQRSLFSIAVPALCLGLASAAAQADQLSDIQQRKELRCGTFADVPPFAAPNPKTREMVGFDVDLCQAIAKRLGVAAKIGKVRVEMGETECKVPAATEYIQKIRKMNRLGKKRKSARCCRSWLAAGCWSWTTPTGFSTTRPGHLQAAAATDT